MTEDEMVVMLQEITARIERTTRLIRIASFFVVVALFLATLDLLLYAAK